MIALCVELCLWCGALAMCRCYLCGLLFIDGMRNVQEGGRKTRQFCAGASQQKGCAAVESKKYWSERSNVERLSAKCCEAIMQHMVRNGSDVNDNSFCGNVCRPAALPFCWKAWPVIAVGFRPTGNLEILYLKKKKNAKSKKISNPSCI